MRNTDKSDNDVVYGIHPVEELFKNAKRPVEKVYIDKNRKSGALFAILKECRKKKIHCNLVAEAKLNGMTRSGRHQGIVAICGEKKTVSIDEILKQAAEKDETPLLVIADSVEDPRNLGAVIRTALAAGAHGVVLPAQGGTGLTAAVSKSSAGALEKMQIARPRDIAGEMGKLKEAGFSILGLDHRSKTHYREANVNGPVAIVIGGEDKGIRPHIRRNCTDLVHIPINDNCQSLNLSVAAGIFLFEIVHQRSERR